MRMPRVCFQMIVYESSYVLAQCLESVLPFGPVIAAEGPVGYWRDHGPATSVDGTNEILAHYRIPTIHGQWSEKDAMVNAGLERVPDDTEFIWVLDSDELWRPDDIQKILWLLSGGHIDSMAFRAWSFYGGFSRIMGGFEENFEVHRIQRWHPGALWATHRPPTIMAPDGRPWREHRHMNAWLTDRDNLRFWHYSYVFPYQMHRKARYYHDYNPAGTIPDYFERVYLPWVLAEMRGDRLARQEIEDRFDGVHDWLPARRGPCRTREFYEHPPAIAAVLPGLQEILTGELRAMQCIS